MASYTTNVKSEIARWREAGLIDAPTAGRLTADIEARRREGISFGSIIGMLAAILVAAAVLLFVAANWEEIPRLVRVALLFALIAAGYVGGAVTKLRGAVVWGEAMYLVAAVAFGASIALIGQMYHLSGDEVQAIGVWAAGTAFAAALLRSPVLSVGSVMLATAWMVGTGSGLFSTGHPSAWYLAACAVLWALSFWTRSPYARVFVLLGLLLYGTMFTLQSNFELVAPVVMALASVALFAFAVWLPRQADRLAGLGTTLPAIGLFGFLLGMALIQIEADDMGTSFLVAVVVLVGIVAALLVAGRESRRLRRLAYAGFAAELVYLYVQYLGTMLDTASFFLAAGLVLAGVALVLRRVEKRFAAPEAPR